MDLTRLVRLKRALAHVIHAAARAHRAGQDFARLPSYVRAELLTRLANSNMHRSLTLDGVAIVEGEDMCRAWSAALDMLDAVNDSSDAFERAGVFAAP